MVRWAYEPRLVLAISLALGVGNAAPATSAIIECSREATLSWTAASGPVESYVVWVSENGEPSYTSSDLEFTGTRATVRGQFGSRYVFRVSARDAEGNAGPLSPPSAEIRFENQNCRPAPFDLNADGISDVLIYDASIGGWLFTLATTEDTTLGILDRIRNSALEVKGSGDFDGNGYDDLLMRDRDNGHVRFGFMGLGPSPVKVDSWTNIAIDWEIAGIGDFDGDGRSDILWRHSIGHQLMLWKMNGAEGEFSYISRGTFGTGWEIAAVRDFDDDGMTDILWRYTPSGTVALWLMNGVTRRDVEFLGSLDSSFRQAFAGDFDGDGLTDVVWTLWNGTGPYSWWLDDYGLADEGYLFGMELDTSVVAVGDYDGDGKDDLLMQNRTSGVLHWREVAGDGLSGGNRIPIGGWDWDLITNP